jgi:hypothetical protein
VKEEAGGETSLPLAEALDKRIQAKAGTSKWHGSHTNKGRYLLPRLLLHSIKLISINGTIEKQSKSHSQADSSFCREIHSFCPDFKPSLCKTSFYFIKMQGSALLFWDMYPDGNTTDRRALHASCPIFRGSKWTATRWIHVRPNEG